MKNISSRKRKCYLDVNFHTGCTKSCQNDNFRSSPRQRYRKNDISRNFHHWLHQKLSKWQLHVQPITKISSILHFSVLRCFSGTESGRYQCTDGFVAWGSSRQTTVSIAALYWLQMRVLFSPGTTLCWLTMWADCKWLYHSFTLRHHGNKNTMTKYSHDCWLQMTGWPGTILCRWGLCIDCEWLHNSFISCHRGNEKYNERLLPWSFVTDD